MYYDQTPYVDPVTAAAQQQQLAPQGFVGNLLGQVGRPLGSAIGGAFGNSGLGGQVGGFLGGLGRYLPFEADPVAQAYAQQAAMQQQLAPQGFFGDMLGGIAGNLVGRINPTAGRVVSGLSRFLPFEADPVAQAYAQQAAMQQQQLAPQGFFGDMLGGLAGNLVGRINPTAGRVVSGLSRFLPFEADPVAQAYAQQQQIAQAYAQQQQQLAPQGFFGDMFGGIAGNLVGRINPTAGRVVSGLSRFLPFEADPIAQAYAQQAAMQQQQLAQAYAQQQQQLAPQGFFGDLISGVGGNLVGRINPTAGRVVSGLGRLLPFQAGPAYGYGQGMY